jgi:hypothetical protein
MTGTCCVTRRFRALAVLLLAASLVAGASGCARRSALVNYAPTSGYRFSPPPPDKALVVFLRPAFLGYAISAAVYEDDKFLGIVMRHSYIEHLTPPGKHLYMVVSEAADFLGADLQGGKIYFVQVVPRMGAWRARFSLHPITPSGSEWEVLPDWLDRSYRAVLNQDGIEWARENDESVKEKKDDYLPVWEEKPERPELRPADGVAQF